MNRRHALLLLIVSSLAMLVVGFSWRSPTRTAITREHAARIARGMTRAEVEAILGGPARDETDGMYHVRWEPVEPVAIPPIGVRRGQWTSGECAVAVLFHEDRVLGVFGGDTYLPQEPVEKTRPRRLPRP
jgi:hypothetical protein